MDMRSAIEIAQRLNVIDHNLTLTQIKNQITVIGSLVESNTVKQHRLNRQLAKQEIQRAIDELDVNDNDHFDPYEVLGNAKEMLYNAGVTNIEHVDVYDPKGALMLAEAVNWAAKVIDPDFYAIKPLLVVACSLLNNVESGWDRGVFYLYHNSIGEVSFHDPYDQIWDCQTILGIPRNKWEHGWSEINRQPLAFDTLTNPKLQKRLANLSNTKYRAKIKNMTKAPINVETK